jgi:hypothetical protein
LPKFGQEGVSHYTVDGWQVTKNWCAQCRTNERMIRMMTSDGARTANVRRSRRR